jgi:hypothetical protein
MKLLAQKSLKTELRLKGYESLNFQGLKHKITKLKIDFLLKLGLNLICGKLRGLGERVWDLLDFDLFLKGKIGGPDAQVRWTTSGRRFTGPWWTPG